MFLVLLLALVDATLAQDDGNRRRDLLDFPARGATAADTNPHWFYGGHTAAEMLLKPSSHVKDKLLGPGIPLAMSLGSQRVELPDSIIAEAKALNPNSLMIAGTHALDSGMLGRYDVATKSFVWKHDDLPRPITALALNGEQVIIGDDAGGLFAFDSANGDLRWERNAHTKMVTTVLSISESLGASGDWTGKILLWDPSNGNAISSFQQHRDRIVELVCIAPDKRLAATDATPASAAMASASRDGTVRLWYPAQRRLVRFVQVERPITAMACLANSQVIVATDDRVVHQIDLEQAAVLSSTQCSLDFVTHLVAVDEQMIMALQGNGAVELLQLRPPIVPNE